MNQKEESQRKLLLFLLVVIIVGLSGWLIYSLYGYTRTSSSTKTNKIIENDKKEQKKKKEEKKTEEKDELQELTDKMMIPFTEYNGYVITADSNNYFFTNDSYTFDTISDEQKVAIAIIIYRETIDDENDIPSYQVRVGQVVSLKDKSKAKQYFVDMAENAKSKPAPKWLEADYEKVGGKVVSLPARENSVFPNTYDEKLNEKLPFFFSA